MVSINNGIIHFYSALRRLVRPKWAIAMLPFLAIAGVFLLINHGSAVQGPPLFQIGDGKSTKPASVITDPSGAENQVLQFGATINNGTDFVHPGILNDQAQLEFIKTQLAAGVNPWTGALAKVIISAGGKLAYTPHPAATLDRTTLGSNGVNGGANLNADGVAAVTQALEYYYASDSSPNKDVYAQNTIKILNAWATTLNTVTSGSQLDAAWAAEALPRAAEIIRYTYTAPAGEPTLNISAFTSMLTTKFLPQLDPSSAGSTSSNGNWELSMADGTMNIGVFTDNRTIFNTGVDMWRTRVPAYIYEDTDNGGNGLPVTPPGPYYTTSAKLTCFWVNAPGSSTCTIPTGFKFTNGLSQETCRDTTHVIIGFEAMINGAETARMQGVDLYGEQQKRIIDGYEFNAKYDLQAAANLSADGSTGTVQDGVCGGKLNMGGTGYQMGWEMVYNEFANRLGIAMPYTQQMIAKVRPTSAALEVAWETLTNAGKDLPGSCTTPDTRLGTSTLKVNIPTDGTYQVWTRLNPAQDGATSYNLQVDYGCPMSVGGGNNTPANQWSWIDYKNANPNDIATVTLSAGTHTLTLSGQSPSLNVSRLMLVSGQSCVPVGIGINCEDVTPPTPPTTVQATAVTSNSVLLNWSGATDDQAIDHYVVYRDGVQVATSAIGVYVDSGLAPNTTYNYTIRTVDTAGNSSASSQSVAVQTPPLPLTVSVSVPSSLSGTEPLTATTSNDSQVTKVDFLLDGNVIGSVPTSPFTLSWDTTSVADGPHVLQAQAYDSTGTAIISNAVVANVKNAPPIYVPTPTGLSGQPQPPASAVISWNAAADGSGVTGYRVLRDGVQIGSTTVNSYTDTSISVAHTYNYTVEATDDAGDLSDPSEAVSVTLLDTTAPSAPTGVSAHATSASSVTVSWLAATDDVGVASYDILRDGTVVGSVGSDSSYTDTSVSASSSYTYTVVAHDAAGNTSAASSGATVTTPAPPDTTAPSAPGNPTATALSQSSASVTWQASSDNVGVASYTIRRNGVTIASGVTNLTYVDQGLSAATPYTYTIYAVDAAGNVSSGSSSAPLTTPDTTPPGVPTNITAGTRTGTSVAFSWQPPTDNVGVVSYSIARNGVVVVSGLTNPTYTDSGLTPATSYAYVVYARDAAGNVSAGSQSVAIATIDTLAPTQPGNFTGMAASTSQVNLSWGAATDNVGVTGYLLSRNGTLLTTTTALAYSNTGLATGTSYTYTLVAIDAAGNQSTVATFSASTLQAVAPAGAGFAAEYFNNTTLSGPAVTRLDPTINFNWGTAAPMSGIGADNFSVRWTGTVTPKTSGTYTLYTQTDDDVRLWVNGTLLIDQWAVRGNYTASYKFTAGTSYSIKMEYVEKTGSALANLQWSATGVTKAVIPSTVISSVSPGLTGTYYATNDLSGTPAVIRPDSNVNFAWGTAAPDSRLGADNFSVRWTGKVKAVSSGTYTFYTDSDDGVRLWVNNQLLIDNWTPHSLATNSGTISLSAGTQYIIRVEYRELTGSATAKLYWSYGSTAKVIIPTTSLFDK